MGPAEASDFINGYSRRQRAGWEQTRLLSDVVCKIMGGEGSGITFPWEDNTGEITPDDEKERVERLREWAKKMEEKL